MKWYKHDSNANSDAKLRRVRLKYGMEGYGLYWYCLELIAQNVEKDSLSFELEHDSEIIAADTGIHFERVQEMMTYMVELGLFEQSDGTITCLKLARRCDEYTTKLISKLPQLPTNSGECRDKVRIIRTEQTRTEETEDKGAAPPDGIPLKDGSVYLPLPEDIAKWRRAYPGLDVDAQLRAIAAWNDAAPDRRKTSRGIKKHIVGWLGRQSQQAKSGPLADRQYREFPDD